MLENSTAGLYLLDAAREVTVTREEDHQHVLARYPVTDSHPRDVAVELTWCVIAAGKYRGERAIEVRLDGQRVGELTHAMTQRYGPSVAAVIAAGHRPGCEATITAGDRGLQIQLRLPPADAPVPTPPPAGPPGTPHPAPPPGPSGATPQPGASRAPRPGPTGAASQAHGPASHAQHRGPGAAQHQPGRHRAPLPGNTHSVGREPHFASTASFAPVQPHMPVLPVPAGRPKKSKKVPLAFAGAVVGMVAIISSIASPGDEAPTANTLPLATTTTATQQSTTQAPTTTTTTRPTTTTTRPTTTTPKPKPTTTRPKPTTTRPAPPPPAPEPAPDSGCNPNYDPCVPNDPKDVDCAGGSGDGPSYVKGPVRVIGKDVYRLDANNDGIGCERG